MKNYPCWSRHHFYKHQNENAKDSCTLCIGDDPPFLRPRALVNNGIAKPNWAQRERKMAFDDQRAPDLRWHPQGVSKKPPQKRQHSRVQQHSQIAIHGPPPNSSRPTSTTRQLSAVCPSVPEDRTWTEPRHFPVPGRFIPGNLWNLDIPTVSTIPSPLGSSMRHMTTMHSPSNPSYVTTNAEFPIEHITQLRTDPTFENVMAHQSF